MPKKLDLVKQRFGDWIVIDESDHRDKNGLRFVVCQCKCGYIKEVRVATLTNGTSTNCGCNNIKRLKENPVRFKHGQSIGGKTKEYRTWKQIKGRCYNLNNQKYKNYGGRGITVCDRWLDKEHGFENFLQDMGECPGPEYSIDRIDNNGNYCPENTRWATPREQCNNKRDNHIVLYNGQKYTLAQLCREIGIPYHRTKLRLYRGWNIEDTIGYSSKKDSKSISEKRFLEHWHEDLMQSDYENEQIISG